MSDDLVTFSIEEPRSLASTWKGVLSFIPANDLAVIEILDLQSTAGEELLKLGELKYLALTPRYLNGIFHAAEKGGSQTVVVVYSIDSSRVSELRGMGMKDAFDSGILRETLGIGDLIIQGTEARPR
jgi:hypothetical protein